jgi:hypothetical protein
MPDPIPTPEVPTPRTKNAIDLRMLDEIKKGEDVSEGLLDPIIAAALAGEELAPTAQSDLATLCGQARTLGDQLITATQIKETATKAEQAAYKILMPALRLFQKPAKRKFAGDAASQKAYFIGVDNFGVKRSTLEQDAGTIISRATADNLPGVTPLKIAAATDALRVWKEKDAVQTVAIRDHATLQKAFEAKVAKIMAARRDIQIAGDTAMPHTDAANAASRRLLKLPPTTPYNPGLGTTA